MTDTEVKTLCTLTISTHTSRVGCDDLSVKFIGGEEISTHTSSVGCDNALDTTIQQMFAISTHTSRVGCDYR